MKTIIEMAREAGFAKYMTDGEINWQMFERFAALVREDAIDKFNRQLNQACEEARLLDHSEQDLNMVQAPVACVLITYGREPECVTYDAIEELPEGEHNLYRAPPTAALAARGDK